MNILSLAASSAWKVLAVSLVLGAGIPALFAVGVRGIAVGNGEMTDGSAAKPMGKIVAALCFLVVLAAVALGLTVIISSGFGKAVSFEHIYPTIIDKKK